MKSICFFSHFHNGDIFHTKAFISEIIKNIDTKFYYSHQNNPIITKDLNLDYTNIVDIGHYTKFLETENCLYVNTWIGCYFSEDNEYSGECSLRAFHRMFSLICDELNKIFDCNIKLGKVDDYYPFVDYSKFNCKSIDEFLIQNKNQKILFCNGPSLSGQSDYTGDMSDLIEKLAEIYEDKIFIATQKFETNFSNITFTNDIINSINCDLNEISYLSKFCDVIVGRNSGPFCFCVTDENISDKTKNFFAFGKRETDCIPYELEIESSFIFECFTSVENLFDSILNLISEV